MVDAVVTIIEPPCPEKKEDEENDDPGTYCSPTVPLGNIEDFVVTCIVLKKDKNGLGVGIVGGRNTYLETVCVSEIYPGGAACRDGRLRRGDILLEVNDVSLRAHTQQQAAQALRQASSPVKLRVLRENPETLFVTDEDPCRFVTVTLKKTMVAESLGLSLMGSQWDNLRITIRLTLHYSPHLPQMPGSVSARKGKILQGDKILEINGQDVRKKAQKEVAQILRNAEGEVVLLLGRVPTKAMAIQEWSRHKMAALEADSNADGNLARMRAFTWSYTTAQSSPLTRRSRQPAEDKRSKLDDDTLESDPEEDQPSRMLLEFPLRPRVNTNVVKSPIQRRPLFKLIRMSFKRSTSLSPGNEKSSTTSSLASTVTSASSPGKNRQKKTSRQTSVEIKVPEVVIHEPSTPTVPDDVEKMSMVEICPGFQPRVAL